MVKFIAGQDDYLFLANDTNDVLKQTTGEYDFPDDLAWRIWTCHATRRFLCGNSNTEYRHVVIPNKETVYAAKLPTSIVHQSHGPTPVNRWFHSIADAATSSFWCPTSLAQREDGVETYPRTDTHWNAFGAHRYLRAALAFFGDSAKLAELDNLELFAPDPTPAIGDLAVHAGLPPELMLTLWPRYPTGKIRFESPAPRFGYVRHYTNERRVLGHQRALILHDSFVGWMLPFLAELYSELILLLCPDLDPLLLRHFQPDVLWFFQCERFFVRSPSNELDILPWVAAKEEEAQSALSGANYLKELLGR